MRDNNIWQGTDESADKTIKKTHFVDRGQIDKFYNDRAVAWFFVQIATCRLLYQDWYIVDRCYDFRSFVNRKLLLTFAPN